MLGPGGCGAGEKSPMLGRCLAAQKEEGEKKKKR